MKAYRQSAILDLVVREPIRSQEALRCRLRARGLDATQATLSRDIKELGLVKRASDGAYRPPDDRTPPASGEDAIRRAVTTYLRGLDTVRELLVLRTDAGQAQVLALAIDHARLPAVVGTLAGDDTVLVITRESRQARTVARRFEGWARGRT